MKAGGVVDVTCEPATGLTEERHMMHGATRVFLFCAALLLTTPLLANEARVVEQSDSEIIFELATDDVSIEEVVHGGESFVSVNAPWYGFTTEVGAPRLPRKSVLLAIPDGASYELDVLSTETRSLGRHRVEPVPEERIVGDGEFVIPVQTFTADPAFRSLRAAWPPRVAELGAEGRLRHHRVVRVVLHPVSYVPATGELTLRTRVVARLRLSGPAGVDGRVTAPVAGDEWNAIYDATILNAGVSRGWRSRKEALESHRRLRFSDRDDAWKVRIGETGVYRVDFSDLSAEGFPSTHSVDDLAVYERSFDIELSEPFVQTPVAVEVHDADQDGTFDGSDYLLFMAESFEEAFNDSGFKDRWTTENVYWIAPNPELAARMESRPAWYDWSGLTPPTSFRDTLRFEQDEYFLNTPPNDRVDLWHWTDTFGTGGDNHLLPFSVHDVAPGADVRLRARWHGRVGGTHRIELSIVDDAENETDLGVFSFSGISQTMDEDIYLSGPIDPEAFSDGQNSLHAVGLGDYSPGRSGANLDWFSIAYDRLFRAESGRLQFTNAGVTGQLEARVEGFGSDDIALFDVSDPDAPVALTLEGANTQPDTDVALVFQDSVASFTRYEALERTAALEPLGIERRTAAGLATSESEVIVISYDGFSTAVQELVDYRESEGWTVTLADLTEVYDAFGGGLPSDRAIRNYLTYAFDNWTSPPQYALLVGDASEDTRGVKSSAAPNYMPTHVFRGSSGGKLVGSDQWYVSFADDVLVLPQMMIGRLPAGSTEQVELVTEKIQAYETMSASDTWRNRIMQIADDAWSYPSLESSYAKYIWEQDFEVLCLEVADTVAQSPAGIDTVNFILSRYTDPFHGDTVIGDIFYAFETVGYVRGDGNATNDVLSMLSDGALLVNFVGHGNRTQLTHEQLILATAASSSNDLSEFDNNGKPFVFFGMSCELSRFLDSNEGTSIDCVTEQMLHLGGSRGAVATFACVGSSRQSWNRLLDISTFKAYFSERADGEGWPRWTIGGLTTQGTINAVIEQGYAFTESRTFALFGDPLTKFDASPPEIRATVNGEDFVSGDFIDAVTAEFPIEIVAEIIDEVEIERDDVVVTAGDLTVPASEYTLEALVDTAGSASRRYRLTYTAVVDPEFDRQIRIEATDAAGQTSAFVIQIEGGDDIRIREVANHPNPFTTPDGTKIIYTLNQSGADVTIRLFTVGGRLIRVFNDASNDLNYNEVYWDGTDSGGDEVANGVYLYTIDVETGDGGSTSADVGRMVKMN
ncbi:MAG: hypothetical protein GF405_01020 [Candidatus Eisenbacteria bacterium]|nr:hypothetical protein [Candidatus Eisenbacteria bacterium]